MNESIKIAALVLTPYLVLGALFYFTRRDPKRQFYVLVPILVAVNLWLGFSNDWRISDFFGLGTVILSGLVGGFLLFRPPVKK